MVPLNCSGVMTVELPYRQQKLEKVMDQEGLADEEVSNRIATERCAPFLEFSACG